MIKLPRLYNDWFNQPQLFRRYWDMLCNRIEGQFPIYTFSTLPKDPSAGDKGYITDSSVTTFYSVVSAGGTSTVPVFYDGTNWRVG